MGGSVLTTSAEHILHDLTRSDLQIIAPRSTLSLWGYTFFGGGGASGLGGGAQEAQERVSSTSELYRGHCITLIQEVLRHKNPNTTARHIQSLGLEEAREALQTTLRLPT